MPKWSLAKAENKQHNADDSETVTYEATIKLDADVSTITLADVATLVAALTSEDGIPTSAVLGNSIDVALRWTDADL